MRLTVTKINKNKTKNHQNKIKKEVEASRFSRELVSASDPRLHIPTECGLVYMSEISF